MFVSNTVQGSPVQRYDLYACRWIVEVDGKRTPNLQTFIDVIKELESEEFVRVKTIDLNGEPSVLTLKQDLHYWPSWQLIFDRETSRWHRKTI